MSCVLVFPDDTDSPTDNDNNIGADFHMNPSAPRQPILTDKQKSQSADSGEGKRLNLTEDACPRGSGL